MTVDIIVTDPVIDPGTEAGPVKGNVMVAVSMTGINTTVAVEAEVVNVIGESVRACVTAGIRKATLPRLLGC